MDTKQERGDSYHQTLKAVFVAPVSGAYSFWVSADDNSKVLVYELQAEDTTSQAVTVFDNNGWCDFFFQLNGIGVNSCQGTTKSVDLYLEAGKEYILEGRHQEGFGEDHFSLGLVVPASENYTAYNSLHQVERVKIEYNITYEVQRLDIPVTDVVTGGRYFITWSYTDNQGVPKDNVMVQIAGTANAAAVKTTLKGSVLPLGDIDVVACSSSTPVGICWDITFKSLISAGSPEREVLEVRFAELLDCGGSSCGGTTPGTDGFFPGTRTVSGDVAPSGTFTIHQGDLSTAPLSWGVQSFQVKAALESAGFFGGSFYVVRYFKSDYLLYFDIEHVGQGGPVDNVMQLNTTELHGPPKVSVTTEVMVAGSYDRLLTPVPSYMLFTVESTPQVHVVSDGHPALCNITGSCEFNPSFDLTPTISTMSQTTYVANNLIELTFTGEGFSNITSNYNITVAGEICEVTSVTEVSGVFAFVCELRRPTAGTYSPLVYDVSRGLASNAGDFAVVMPLEVNSSSALSGSAAGGTPLTITGLNFPEADPSLVKLVFALPDESAIVTDLEVTRDSISFRTPPRTDLVAQGHRRRLMSESDLSDWLRGFLVTSVASEQPQTQVEQTHWLTSSLEALWYMRWARAENKQESSDFVVGSGATHNHLPETLWSSFGESGERARRYLSDDNSYYYYSGYYTGYYYTSTSKAPGECPRTRMRLNAAVGSAGLTWESHA